MKLLFDQNLSHRLLPALVDLFPGSTHVRDLGMERQDDDKVWIHARQHGLVILSKDNDFLERGLLYGPPPKVIYLGLGNCTTRRIEELLRASHNRVVAFGTNPDEGVLILG